MHGHDGVMHNFSGVDGLDNTDRCRILGIIDELRAPGAYEDIPLLQVVGRPVEGWHVGLQCDQLVELLETT